MLWSAAHIGSFRSLLRLGAPLILSQLALMGIGVTDSIMLGWYSVEALAAGVLGHTVFFVIFIVGGLFWYSRHALGHVQLREMLSKRHGV